MVGFIIATFYPVSYFFTKYHYVNTYSHRFEIYAVKNGGYKKFREKMFKSHKIPGNWLGAYSWILQINYKEQGAFLCFMLFII